MIKEATTTFAETVQMVDRYGIIVFAVMFLGLLIYIIKRIMDNADKREISYTESNNKFVESLNKINASIDKRNEGAKEFQNFVRVEHKEILQDHKDFGKSIALVCDALGRINGYTDDHGNDYNNRK